MEKGRELGFGETKEWHKLNKELKRAQKAYAENEQRLMKDMSGFLFGEKKKVKKGEKEKKNDEKKEEEKNENEEEEKNEENEENEEKNVEEEEKEKSGISSTNWALIVASLAALLILILQIVIKRSSHFEL